MEVVACLAVHGGNYDAACCCELGPLLSQVSGSSATRVLAIVKRCEIKALGVKLGPNAGIQMNGAANEGAGCRADFAED